MLIVYICIAHYILLCFFHLMWSKMDSVVRNIEFENKLSKSCCFFVSVLVLFRIRLFSYLFNWFYIFDIFSFKMVIRNKQKTQIFCLIASHYSTKWGKLKLFPRRTNCTIKLARSQFVYMYNLKFLGRYQYIYILLSVLPAVSLSMNGEEYVLTLRL